MHMEMLLTVSYAVKVRPQATGSPVPLWVGRGDSPAPQGAMNFHGDSFSITGRVACRASPSGCTGVFGWIRSSVNQPRGCPSERLSCGQDPSNAVRTISWHVEAVCETCVSLCAGERNLVLARTSRTNTPVMAPLRGVRNVDYFGADRHLSTPDFDDARSWSCGIDEHRL